MNDLFVTFVLTLCQSASTPVVAAMIAIINGERVKAGRAKLGWIHPMLYKNHSLFARDITSGNNKCTASSNCCEEGFYATTGWDPLTGLGVVDFRGLYNLLFNLGYTYTPSPTGVPTARPSAAPTAPTAIPTRRPTRVPTTARPSVEPTFRPTTAAPTIRSVKKPSSGSSSIIIIVIVVALVILVAGAGSYYYFYMQGAEKGPEDGSSFDGSQRHDDDRSVRSVDQGFHIDMLAANIAADFTSLFGGSSSPNKSKTPRSGNDDLNSKFYSDDDDYVSGSDASSSVDVSHNDFDPDVKEFGKSAGLSRLEMLKFSADSVEYVSSPSAWSHSRDSFAVSQLSVSPRSMEDGEGEEADGPVVAPPSSEKDKAKLKTISMDSVFGRAVSEGDDDDDSEGDGSGSDSSSGSDSGSSHTASEGEE